MQLIVTDTNPHAAAAALDDRHVLIQIPDCVQLLTAAANVKDGHAFPHPFRHKDHGLVRWLMNDINNFFWTMAFTYGLTAEFMERFGEPHRCDPVMWGLMKAYGYEKANVKAFLNRAPGYLHMQDPITAYRLHMDKTWNAAKVTPKWTNKKPPKWYTDDESINTTYAGRGL